MDNPKVRQNWIIDELKINPLLSYTEVFSIYKEKYSLGEMTFVKDWKKASEVIKDYQDAINKAKLSESISQEKKALKRNILTKFDAMEILTEIAQGKARKIEGQIVMPSFSDRRNAIETLSKFQGWNAPIKTSNENLNVDLVKLTPEEVKLINEELEKKY